jgi:hypothetical protein
MSTPPEFAATIDEFMTAVEAFHATRERNNKEFVAAAVKAHSDEDATQFALAHVSKMTMALEDLTGSLVAAVSALVVEVSRLGNSGDDVEPKHSAG